MRIAKYPFAILSAALFSVMLVTPITSISNLMWLSSVEMPVTILSTLEVILFDFQRLGVALCAVFFIAFAIAFTVSGLISKYTNFGGKKVYALAGAPASAYNFFPPKFVYFEIKPETVKAIAKAIEKTANKATPSL